MSEEPLKPCPFCGGRPERTDMHDVHAELLTIWSVECSRCGAEIADDESQDAADRHWNMRTAPSDVETHFWSIVDRDGLAGVPSDMWDALDRIVRRANDCQRLRIMCNELASHLRFAIKLIGAFGRTAQLEAMQRAIWAHEEMP